MNNKSVAGVHWSFWLIGAIALLWNVMGCINYLMQMNPDTVASMPETHRAIIDSRPAWATAGFAIGVFGGALGSLMLLMKKSSAFYVFIASLLGIVVTMLHTLRIPDFGSRFSAFELVLMIISPLVVAVFLLWYIKYSGKKGWIN